MTIGLVTATAAGRAAAAELAGRWDGTRTYGVGQLDDAWHDCDALVCFLAVGAVVRLLAPLLDDKRRDPGVVCVDEARRFAVAVVGGHGRPGRAGGANALAHRVADALGLTPVVTTATDGTGMSPLDELGWPVEGDIAAVTRALLDGDTVTLTADATWPLPALPALPADRPRPPCLLVTDRLVEPPRPAVVVRPPSLVVGAGASRGVPADEVVGLVTATLTDAGLASGSIAHLATVEAKAGEPGVVAAAHRLGVPLVAYPASRLAAIDVPHPSAAVRAAVGTASVAEAAAMAEGAELVVAKRKSAMATVAVARRRPRGRLAIVGTGPGARDLMTTRAVAELRRSSVVVGLHRYVEQVRDLLRPGTRIEATGLGAEEQRARTAVRLARAGHAVALIGGGDAGVYAMASPALEWAGRGGDGGAEGDGGESNGGVEVVGVPGVTAMLAAAALLGAPLGHDHCAISLSDLHTPWAAIEQRVRAAAAGDFVVSFYNPRSRARGWQLPRALAILAERRPGSTPVGVVTDATGPDQRVTVSTLADLDLEADVGLVGMRSLVIVGSSQSRLVAGRFVTPRGYEWCR
jgi:cobalt-precorrin 5A hydrolase/precorrin-3B C17-methyltransferase